MKKIQLFLLLLFSFVISSAQSSISAKLITLTAHPFAKENLVLHQKIDNTGVVTIEPGIIISYDKYLIKKFSFRFSTSFMQDRYKSIAGGSQILLKYKAVKYYKHSFYFGFGPAIHYSVNRNLVKGYTNEDNYVLSNNYLYKISWLSGLLEYNYYISKKLDFSLALNHTDTKSLGLTFGIRYDIPDLNGKGCDCPSYR